MPADDDAPGDVEAEPGALPDSLSVVKNGSNARSLDAGSVPVPVFPTSTTTTVSCTEAQSIWDQLLITPTSSEIRRVDAFTSNSRLLSPINPK